MAFPLFPVQVMEPAYREPLQMVTHPPSPVRGCCPPAIAVSAGRAGVQTSARGSWTAGHGQLADAVHMHPPRLSADAGGGATATVPLSPFHSHDSGRTHSCNEAGTWHSLRNPGHSHLAWILTSVLWCSHKTWGIVK